MARYRTVYNTLDRPVGIDDDGRTIGGGEYGTVLTTGKAGEQADAAIDRGDLVVVERPAGDGPVNPDALAAFDATDALNAADTPEAIAEVADDVDATPTAAAKRAAAKRAAETQEAQAR